MRNFTQVVLSYGSETEFRRALLAILSFYAYLGKNAANTQTLLATDQPSFFKPFLEGLPIQYFVLDKAGMEVMKQPTNYIHRIKIRVIEAALEQTNGDILFADSDTFFLQDPQSYMQKVDAQHAFMHMREYDFASMRNYKPPKGKTYRAFINMISQQDFELADGSRLQVLESQSSWNSGIMLLHASHARLIPDVYALTDQFYTHSGHHASEQFAFGILLQNHVNLSACTDIAYHYWHRVKKQVMDAFLPGFLSPEFLLLSTEARLAKVRAMVPVLYNRLEVHPLIKKDFALQKFKDNDFKGGLKLGVKYVLKRPFDFGFYKAVLQHLGKSKRGAMQ